MAPRVTHSTVTGATADPTALVDGPAWDANHVIEGLDIGSDVQAHDADLDAIAALTPSNDDIIQRKDGTWTNRTLAQYIADLGSLGTTFQPLDSDLTAIAALATTSYGRGLLTLANVAALVAEVDPYFLTPAEGNAAYQPLDSDLTAIAALTTTSFGRAFLALADASASRTYLSLVPGTDIQAYDSDLAALAANSTNGLWARTGAGTGAARTITGPAAGITVTNGDGVSGNPTLALANDLAALEGLASTGLIARTATDTATTRTITGTANQITVTNGDGVSGNPTLSIPSNAALPGSPTTTTASALDNSTKIATTAYVDSAVLAGGGGGGAHGFTNRVINPSGQIRQNIGSDWTFNVTISNASPAVVTLTGHSIPVGTGVTFTTTGSLPTGITAGTIYYVLAANLTINTFQISTTPGGSAVNTSSAGSGTHSVVVAFADGAYTGFDQWQALTQSSAVWAAPLAGAENSTPFMMRITQANSSAQRFGMIQWMESANITNLRGQAVTLSARVRMSAATTLRYAIVEWTGTADTITKDIVLDWTNGTFTAGQFFTSTSTVVTATGSTALSSGALTSISVTGTVGSTANNIAVFFWTDSTQAQSVTLDIGKVQLEAGSSATALAFRSFQEELVLCQRYFCRPHGMTTWARDFVSSRNAGFAWASTGIFSPLIAFPVQMRVAPSVTPYAPSLIVGATPTSGQWQWYDGASVYANASATAASDITEFNFFMGLTVTGATSKSAYIINGNWSASARL